MARRHKNGRGGKYRWKAEVKVDGLAFYVGGFNTEGEAQQAEDDFRESIGRPRRYAGVDG